MELEDKIKRQYSERASKESLYNSLYSVKADEEKSAKAKQLLAGFLGDLRGKKILEIGAGQGGNVPMLMDCGFGLENISLNEILPERIAAIRKNYPGIKVFEGDALKAEFSEQYDCVFQSTVFTSVLDQKSRKDLADKMWQLLKPGGIILWYDFIYNNPSNPSVKKVSVKELKSLFPAAKAQKIKKVTLAPPLGRRVASLYFLFNLPFLRSHVLAVFKK